MFYHACNLIIMKFYFYKSYQRIIRQHLYMNIKYIPMKTQHHTLNTFQWKHYNTLVRLHHKVSIAPPFALIRSEILLGIELLSSSRTFGCYTIHTHFHVSSFIHSIWLPISFFIIFETFLMGSMSGEFLGHSRTGIPLPSTNVLVSIELWHGARSCIQIFSTCGNTTHSLVISIPWIISLWYFALSMLPFTFLRRDRPRLLIAPQPCTLTGLNIFSMLFLILFASNTSMASIVMTLKYRHMWMRCVPTEGMYLYAWSRAMT